VLGLERVARCETSGHARLIRGRVIVCAACAVTCRRHVAAQALAARAVLRLFRESAGVGAPGAAVVADPGSARAAGCGLEGRLGIRHGFVPFVGRVWEARWLRVVDVAAMAERYDDNQKNTLVDGVDDAVVADAYPHPGAGTTVQSFCARRAGILTEQGDRPADAIPICGVDVAQGLERCGPDLDPVRAHSVPAEVGFDLRPGDVLALFGHGHVERSHILSVLQRIHHALVLCRADDDGFDGAASLEEDSLLVGALDDLREGAPGGGNGDG
jgi:hypothetical protein